MYDVSIEVVQFHEDLKKRNSNLQKLVEQLLRAACLVTGFFYKERGSGSAHK